MGSHRIDVDNDFKPLYVVSPDKKDQIKKLKSLLADVDELYLATDEDREGEAIAWHLLEVLNPRVPVKRMVFHEITPDAIQAAIESPRELDRRLVDAQEGAAHARPPVRLRGVSGVVEEGPAAAVGRSGPKRRHPYRRRSTRRRPAPSRS